MKSKVLAIYLPQFHTIPENDEWWGEGFTEWANVRRGKALYPGHYQPREPLKDNYYNLDDLRVLEKHIRMARKAGIKGFCFYHYYFEGRTLLEKPIEEYRDHSKEDFPYCLIWANQSWARTWYRSKAGNQILLKQSYGNQDAWEKHFFYLLKFFRDERYIKICNKPVYIMYLPQDIHFRKQMFELWEKLAIENGFSGIYLIAMNTYYGKDSRCLYDAYMEFEPMCTLKNDNSWRKALQVWKEGRLADKRLTGKRLRNWLYAQNAFSYSYLCREMIRKNKKTDQKTCFGFFAGWDNTARKDEDGLIVRGSSPKRFGKYLEYLLKLSEKQGKEFIFLNAWNEWSEGAYIEPDKKYGYAYLKMLKKAIQRYENQR